MDQILANNTNADDRHLPCGCRPTAPGTTTVPDPDHRVLRGVAARRPTTSATRGWASNTEPSLNFRFTARDLDPEAGGYAFGDVKLRSTRPAGRSW